MFPRFCDLVNAIFGTHFSFLGYTYGFFYVTGFVAAGTVAYLELKRKSGTSRIPPASERLILHFMAITLIFTLTGAKLFHFLEHPGVFMADPSGAILTLDGFSFYGGFVFASVAVILFARRQGISLANIGDVAAPAILACYAIGRMGCQLSGDGCWGRPNPIAKPAWIGPFPDWVWRFDFPHNVINSGIPIPGCEGSYCHVLPEMVYPTSLYESLMAISCFILLWAFRKKFSTPGYLFSLFLVLNGATRLLIERVRVNPHFDLFGLYVSQAECIALFVILSGMIGFRHFRK